MSMFDMKMDETDGSVKWYNYFGTVWLFLIKYNIHRPHDPAIPFLDIYPRKIKSCVPTKIRTQIFIALY